MFDHRCRDASSPKATKGNRAERGETSAARTGTGGPPSLVREGLEDPPSKEAVRQLEDAFGRPPRKPGQSPEIQFDYDDVVQQSFPASDPPPPPG